MTALLPYLGSTKGSQTASLYLAGCDCYSEGFGIYQSTACLGVLIAANILPWPRNGLKLPHLLQNSVSSSCARCVDGCALLMQRLHRDKRRYKCLPGRRKQTLFRKPSIVGHLST